MPEKDTEIKDTKVIAREQYTYKICIKPSKYMLYNKLFCQEFKTMQALYTQNPERYLKYFAKYHRFGKDTKGRPVIQMEHINGKTLEEILEKQIRPDPYNHLTPQQTLHLFRQLNDAQHMLCDMGVLHLDLKPENIIVLNDNFDIKLVDLTSTCRFNDPTCGYNVIDYRVDAKLTPPLQLRQVGALLFTRLFYSGKTAYDDHYRKNLSNKFGEYLLLLQCLNTGCAAKAKKDPMYYWSLWLKQLENTLS